MVRQTISACVATRVNKRAPHGARIPPGAFKARKSASSTNSCKVTTVGNIRIVFIGVNKPDKLASGDFPKMLAPRLNQTKSGLNFLRHDKIFCRALNESGFQQ